MQKLVTTSLILFFLVIMQGKAFAIDINCKFKDLTFNGIKSLQITDEGLVINQEYLIPLEKSRVNCGRFGRQTRFDGSALGFQVVLKSCSTEAKLEGHIIDSLNEVAADVLCGPSSF